MPSAGMAHWRERASAVWRHDEAGREAGPEHRNRFRNQSVRTEIESGVAPKRVSAVAALLARHARL